MLRRIARLFLYLLAVVVLMVVGGFAYLFLAFPRTAPPALVEAPRTPERIARGQYLSRHVVGCSDCHGERDWTRYSAPQMREREGHGGMAFHLDIGTLYAPNITPVRLCGKLSCDRGTSRATGGRVRMKAMTDSASSCDICRYAS